MTEISDQTNLEPVVLGKGKLLMRLLVYLLVLGALLFWLAGTVNWQMGWVFLGVFSALNIFSVMIVPLDKELEEERTTIKKDVKPWDKYLAGIPSLLFPLGFLIVGGLDHRYVWSAGFPLWLTVAAIVVGVLGYLFSVWAARENKFYARFVRIQKERGHVAITTGPYRIVRHPGYAGLGLYSLAAAVMLESYWAFIPVGVMVVLLVIRTALEDKTLQEELPGYAAYTQQTRYRLIPGIW